MVYFTETMNFISLEKIDKQFDFCFVNEAYLFFKLLYIRLKYSNLVFLKIFSTKPLI